MTGSLSLAQVFFIYFIRPQTMKYRNVKLVNLLLNTETIHQQKRLLTMPFVRYINRSKPTFYETKQTKKHILYILLHLPYLLV